MLKVWCGVEGAGGLAQELEQVLSDDRQQMTCAAVEHAAAGLGRWPPEWLRRLEAQHQRQGIYAQRYHCLRGAA
eukprot:9501004-Pyramimonas_sp.AAC.1